MSESPLGNYHMENDVKKTLVTTLCIAGFSAYGVSASAQTGFLDGWTGEGSLAGSVTTGNTDTTDIGLGLKLEKATDTWGHKFNALWDTGTVDDVSTRRRFDFGYQIDRNLTDRIYLFGNGDYYKDDFGAFQDGYFVGAGGGYKAILPDPVSWNLEGGAGFRSQQAQDVFADDPANPGTDILTPGLTENEFALRGFSDFDYAFNDNVSLYNDTEILWASSDTYIWNEIGLTAKLAGNLSARASFRVDHHTDAPVGTESTDTTTRFGIVYSIK